MPARAMLRQVEARRVMDRTCAACLASPIPPVTQLTQWTQRRPPAASGSEFSLTPQKAN